MCGDPLGGSFQVDLQIFSSHCFFSQKESLPNLNSPRLCLLGGVKQEIYLCTKVLAFEWGERFIPPKKKCIYTFQETNIAMLVNPLFPGKYHQNARDVALLQAMLQLDPQISNL